MPSPRSFQSPQARHSQPFMDRLDPTAMGSAWATSFASLSVVGVAVAGRWLMSAGSQLGEVSEEIFRGDRLPLLSRSESNPLSRSESNPLSSDSPESGPTESSPTGSNRLNHSGT